MSMVYKLAIVENAILLVGTYFMIQYVAKKVFSDFPIILVQPVSLFITLYIGNSTRTNSAWTETCVLFVFWGQNRPPLLLREEPPLLRPPPEDSLCTRVLVTVLNR